MSRAIREVTIKDAESIIPDREGIRILGKTQEKILRIDPVEKEPKEIDPFLNVEINLLECERLGVFRKSTKR